MATLAIRGHATRGKEVIKILEMLGGKNFRQLEGSAKTAVYIISSSSNSEIDCFDVISDVYKVFTLEEFLKEFPYKVGDKVKYKYDNTTYFIRKMFWKNDKIFYELSDEVHSDGCSIPDTLIFDVDAVKLQPYKEQEPMNIPETMKQITDIAENFIKIDIPKGYEFFGVDDDNQQVVFEKIGCQYPKTYEECCDVLKIEYPYFRTEEDGISASTYKNKLIGNLKQLFICRDAYWKLAGEEMGLGKPWKPDWNDVCDKYTIYLVYGNEIWRDTGQTIGTLLAFPTAEMRDTFYENFKDLINECKELL